MKTYNFTNGKKQTLTYKEISNTKQGCYSKDEVIRVFKTDKIFENNQYDTRFELI